MSTSQFVAGGCDLTPAPSGGEVSGALSAVGGLARAAMSGNLDGALKAMAVEQGKKLATAALMKIFTIQADAKPALPPWAGLGTIAAPGSPASLAAGAAYNAVHRAPVSGATAAAGNGAGGAAAGSTSGAGAGNSQASTSQPFNPRDYWVDIDLNDLAHAAAALVMMPVAIALRSLAWLFPDAMNSLFSSMPKTNAGTHDKDGLAGILFGNNDHDGTPGVVGIAFALSNGLFNLLHLGALNKLFEEGQDAHDNKTGVDLTTGQPIPKEESDAPSSAGQTLGQVLGIMARRAGFGNSFYRVVTSLLGEPDGYGFVTGVWQGTHQESIKK